MDFKKKRLNNALEDRTYRVKLVHGKKGWLAIGLTFITLFGASVLSAKTVDASAVNNVATANSTTSSFVQLYNSVTSNNMHKAGRGLANGTQWKTAKAVKGIDGQTYLLVGGNEYANAKQMDLSDETSSQDLAGIVHVGAGNGTYALLYTNPLEGAKQVTNRALAPNTDWKTDTKVTVDGTTYYRVATDEWVKANDANLTSESSRSDKTYTKNAPDAENTTDNNNNGGSSSSNNSGSHSGGGSTVTTNATVTIHYVDNNGKQIAKDTTTTQKIGSDYDAIAPAIDGYTSKDVSKSIKVVKGNNEITFTYLNKDEVVNYRQVLINLVDDKGTVVGKSQAVQAEIGKDYTATAPVIDGYTLQGDKTQTINVSKDNVNTITFTYKKDVTTADLTVNYVDENGKAITDAKVIPSKIGSSVTEEAKDLTGYTLVGDKSQTVTIGKGGSQITFNYKKDADTTPVDPVTTKANVTIKAVDEDGNSIADDSVVADQEVGKDYTATAPTIDGYTVKGDSTQTVNVEKDGSTVTFTYTKNAVAPKTATVTTKFVDESGKEIADAKSDTAEIGKDFTAKATDVDGYTVKGDATQTETIDGDKTITFTYTKNAEPIQQSTITTAYVDADGNTIKDSATEKVENGKSYTATAPTIDGYTIKGDATQSIDAVTGDATLTFTYTKDAVATPVDTSAVASKVISLVNDYRVANGLSALNVDSNLSAGAVARATTEKGHVDASGDINSANHDEFTNQSQPNLIQYGSTNMAENLAVTSGSTADEVAQNLFDQWKGSTAHNATMLDKSMTDIGVGVQLLDNGMFVGIQDFGGKANTADWNADQFNSTTADSFGLTTDQIKQQLLTKYGIDLGTNYYVSDHLFKTKDDYENFSASTFDNPSPLAGSIWGMNGANGNNGTALIYDAKGNAVGWALYSADMDMSIDEATSQGLTTWIK